MLIEFRFRNFKSFRDEAVFSMVAANLKSRDPDLDRANTVDCRDGLRLLKSAAIYGPNASGKSNLRAALRFMRDFMLNSSRESLADEPIGIEPFRLHSATAGQPTLFEIRFVLKGHRYRYGFELDSRGVREEWLYFTPTVREARLFERNPEGIQLGERFKEGRGLDARTRGNALFLSVVAQFNGPLALEIAGWFRACNVITSLNDSGYRGVTVDCLKNGLYQGEIIELIRQLDLGIETISVESMALTAEELPGLLPDSIKGLLLADRPNRDVIKVSHPCTGKNGKPDGVVAFDLDTNESDGTKKLFALAGPLLDTLSHGQVLFVDELDARLHPIITRELISLFHSDRTNPHNAQLIFTTHDTNLLTRKLFRRDQIWFTEKDRLGVSQLYSLAEFKIRNDASFEADYIRGKFGAIPFPGDFSDIIGPNDAQ